MQSVSSRIWTRVAVSISYDDNDYTTGTDDNMITFLKIQEKFEQRKFVNCMESIPSHFEWNFSDWLKKKTKSTTREKER